MQMDALLGAFTDGDLRRLIQTEGQGALSKTLKDITFKNPITVNADALLNEAHDIFKQSHVDTIRSYLITISLSA